MTNSLNLTGMLFPLENRLHLQACFSISVESKDKKSGKGRMEV